MRDRTQHVPSNLADMHQTHQDRTRKLKGVSNAGGADLKADLNFEKGTGIINGARNEEPHSSGLRMKQKP